MAKEIDGVTYYTMDEYVAGRNTAASEARQQEKVKREEQKQQLEGALKAKSDELQKALNKHSAELKVKEDALQAAIAERDKTISDGTKAKDDEIATIKSQADAAAKEALTHKRELMLSEALMEAGVPSLKKARTLVVNLPQDIDLTNPENVTTAIASLKETLPEIFTVAAKSDVSTPVTPDVAQKPISKQSNLPANGLAGSPSPIPAGGVKTADPRIARLESVKTSEPVVGSVPGWMNSNP